MLRLAPWKVASILAVTFLAVLLLVPSFLGTATVDRLEKLLPSFLPVRPIVLGLDLQGGASLLWEVDSAALTHAQVETLRDDVRGKLREGRISLSGGIAVLPRGVQVRIADAAERAKALPLLRALDQPISNAIIGTAGHMLDITDVGDGSVQLLLTDAAINDKIRRAVTQSIEVLNRRLNESGTKEVNIQQQGVDRILVEVPGLQDTTEVKKLVGATANLEFRLVADPGDPPNEVDNLPQQQGGQIPVQKRVMVAGEDLTNAQTGFDQNSQPDVNFTFNLRGGQRFGQVTSENVQRRFAIVLDGKVISAPVIQTPITGGRGQITGNFTVQEADNLSVLLRAGALPAKLTVVEERTVGPGLGQDSIDAGKRAAIVGGVLVVCYMLATYGIFGVFADVALAVHILFIFASMALIGATLTLPGIAGVVFTIGMAVDSNVLIYERIREEAHMGRSIISALDAGFKRAFATIIDSNVTMFVAAVILYLFGSGPVRGFAVSLGLGILTSVVTAVTMTRMMIALWYRYKRPTKLPI
ncbi:protein translocase subunit SecD [Methylocapsa sp. S129]|uniref:protein translocase subunit SecD n=1 Tax=Methylocapsa sp. S129 TaxID=1641869 RepID=UPI00131D5E06|nr:protein translocase subunit SecD [Methylocapsa sp. S129]